jgi:uncharacterized protein YbjT (DUF2867 family)
VAICHALNQGTNMYTITGASGRVGSVAATHLLDEGQPVRVVVRDPAKGAPWAERGAQVAVADLADRHGLAEALAGSRGAFLLLPFDPTASDFAGETARLTDAIADAVADAAVPHVVMLSSGGADLAEGTGPIVGLHRLEQQLAATGVVVTALRSGHFQEKVSDVLEAARHGGIYPVFADSADVAIPMIATRDLGRVAAESLRNPPASSEVVDVLGPRYTEREVSTHLGAALGRDLEVVTVPQPGWMPALTDAGVPPVAAELLAELYAADQQGLLAPRGDRTVEGTTPLEHTLAGLIGVRT